MTHDKKTGIDSDPKKVMINIYIFLLGGSRGRRHKNDRTGAL